MNLVEVSAAPALWRKVSSIPTVGFCSFDYEKYTCWRRSTEENGVVFCLCDVDVTLEELADAVREFFSDEGYRGLKDLSKCKTAVLTKQDTLTYEFVLFRSKDCQDLRVKGVVVGEYNIQPMPILPANYNITVVEVSNVPIIEEAVLYETLAMSFLPYGRLLDIDLKVRPDTKTFQGDAIVTMDSTPDSDGPFKSLPKSITWHTDKTRKLKLKPTVIP
ncbi:hypothetical protein J3Q64DRAFT_1835604 [Phycomyces blakesleeanus]|uniref:Uncharacterized protein n=1 Tax=Phycomyces blakesleeanus TaxID=4837 RepID=A0ABR3AYS7_PHYBL